MRLARVRSPVLTLLGCAGVALTPSRAVADPASAPVACRRYYDIADYASAIACWKEEYLSHGDAKNLFRIAQAYRMSGDPASAIVFYRKFLAEVGPSYTEAQRAEVEAMIASQQAALRAQGGGATAPSQPASPAPGTTPVLPPVAGPGPTASALPAAHRPWYDDATGDALLGAGVAGLAVGGVALARSLADASAASQAPTVGDFHADDHRSVTEEVVGIGAGALGAALVAAGVLWDAHVATPGASLAVAPLGAGAWVEATARFR